MQPHQQRPWLTPDGWRKKERRLLRVIRVAGIADFADLSRPTLWRSHDGTREQQEREDKFHALSVTRWFARKRKNWQVALPSAECSHYASRVARIKIAAVADIAEGTTVKFSFKRGDRSLEGFAGRYKGKLFAYENTCRHLPISLDYGDNRFFNTEGEALICQTHGAVYEPDTGLCTRGPCAGASLFPLEIVEGEGTVWLKACEE